MAGGRLHSFGFVLLVLTILIFVSFASFSEAANRGKLRPSQCNTKCTYRCSATSHKKPCMFFCLKCCGTCLCVPPGVYGNKQTCPCYNNWKTKEGRPKCP